MLPAGLVPFVQHHSDHDEVLMVTAAATRMGYLVSKYPAVSHTFILREIAALRSRGFEIEVASINDADDRSAMTQVEQVEASRTFYVKQAGPWGALKAMAWLALRAPGRLLVGLRTALKLGGADVSRVMLCLFYLAEAALLARWMRRHALVHLHVHFATPAATVALLLARIAPVTFSMMVHGPDEFYDVTSYFLAEKIEAARFVVCISFFAQSQLMKLSPGEQWPKFDVARLGVDCGHFAPRPFRASPEVFEVLCVGRLVPTKGQRILIQAVEQLLQRGRRVQLRFVGDGPDRKNLELMVTERGLAGEIRFEGAMNQDRIRAFYQAADVFALASFAEGIPVVLMEAMAMEIPCVSTGINGIPELIRDGVDGLLVAPSDVEGLAGALARLMDDASLRETLGKAGRQRVQKSYELSANVDRLAEVFRRRLETIH
ncbi:glycosyltransferase [Edaphobacter flagellatus]|uniref:glycosyltransferase n=1 Tax=Edaphobacter flagellatus TaxID=1933044 RepID=UPI0021B3379C|nr:glycosyltransferase [Edaphobacter flagellatus]